MSPILQTIEDFAHPSSITSIMLELLQGSLEMEPSRAWKLQTIMVRACWHLPSSLTLHYSAVVDLVKGD